jgi:hypothetical protein
MDSLFVCRDPQWPTPYLESLCDRLRAALAEMRCLLNSAHVSPENPLYGRGMVTIYQLVKEREALLAYLNETEDRHGLGERLRVKAQGALQVSRAMLSTYPVQMPSASAAKYRDRARLIAGYVGDWHSAVICHMAVQMLEADLSKS